MDPAERRTQILEQAAGLFGRKGYHATSISDIIEAAGIARGTFYLYFQNKRSIFEELVDVLVVNIKSCIETVDVAAGAPPARTQLSDNIARVLNLLAQNRILLAILLEGAVGVDKGFQDKLDQFYGQITETIELSLKLGQEMGIVRSYDARLAALAATGGLKEILHDLLRNEQELPDLEGVASQIVDIFANGVLVEGASIS